MQYFKDTATTPNILHAFEDDVVAINTNGVYSFEVQRVDHIPEVPEVPAHDVTVTLLTLKVPTTLQPITAEEYATEQAAQLAVVQAATAALPNPDQFIQDVKAGLGGIVAANALSVAYPLFFAAVQGEDWPDVQALILDAKAKNVLTNVQYAAIKAASAANNIPLELS